jgi:hypothetical protein
LISYETGCSRTHRGGGADPISKAANVYIADAGDNEVRELVVKTGIIKDVGHK